jgi:hypothetical protein
MSGAISLDLLPERVALMRFRAGTRIPAWTEQATQFLSVTRTPDELSVAVDLAVVPADVTAVRDYRVLRVRGPMPLDLVGIMAALAVPLAEAGVPILPIASHDTDYILVRESDIARARGALERAGHVVSEPSP